MPNSRNDLPTGPLRAGFEQLRARRAEPPEDLADRCLDGVEGIVTARDLAELGTTVVAKEFLVAVLDAFAHALGFRGPRRER